MHRGDQMVRHGMVVEHVMEHLAELSTPGWLSLKPSDHTNQGEGQQTRLEARQTVVSLGLYGTGAWGSG